MELALLVYAISLISNFQFLVGVLIGVFLMAAGGLFITSSDWTSNKEEEKYFRKWSKLFLIFAFSLSFVFATLPSEKTMYVMVGAYATQKIAENPDVQRLSGKTLKVIEDKLDQYIEEATKPAKGSK
jgi:hypothetical protein